MKKVYLTFKDNDMTEGRGPMVPDKCFSTRKLAEDYIDDQPGVMGIRGKWSKEKYGHWEVREIEVLEEYNSKEELKKQALMKVQKYLSKDELEALNIKVD